MSGYALDIPNRLTVYGNEAVKTFYQRAFDLEVVKTIPDYIIRLFSPTNVLLLRTIRFIPSCNMEISVKIVLFSL